MTPLKETVAAQQRIASLAAQLPVHRAFHWLHLHQPQLREWQIEIIRTPAPPFAEQARAALLLRLFAELGLANPHIDSEGNALALLLPAHEDDLETPGNRPSPASPPNTPVLLLSAHLDTVFPAYTPCDPVELPDSPRILAPGASDNAAGLTALLAIAAALRHAQISPPTPILFAANVGEEGEGDLRGMRHLFLRGPFAGRIAASIVLEGSGTNTVVNHGLGSRRLRLTVSGPGGHSWSDAGTPNPILVLARILSRLGDINLATSDPAIKTTLNIGQISGGTSVNSIPFSATATLDLRSTHPVHLQALESQVREIAACSLPGRDQQKTASSQQFTSRCTTTTVVELIGDRPAASLPANSPLLRSLRAVDRHLAIRTDARTGSTDANLPLSIGCPAIAVGGGGTAGGMHTLNEWYDPTHREAALRRILLTLIDTAQILESFSKTVT